MTGQIPDEVRYRHRRYAITAVDGTGLFQPGDHGIRPGPLDTACWRGFTCAYLIRRDRLILDAVDIGRPEDPTAPPELFGVEASTANTEAFRSGALRYRGLEAPIAFTGRLLLGAGPVHVGYLNMGFRPAWLYQRVHEVTFDAGALTSARDRSAALAEVRRHLGADGLKPAPNEATGDWIKRTFSLTFSYSWPSID
ncbi:hypothetical protein ACNTMW_18110 [Planosporangium sp. 12N6]|uniref:hypothetical protein n=1 Tax=Planosporangium spinosum TaxID=3402278 RepID=UPI003CE93B11